MGTTRSVVPVSPIAHGGVTPGYCLSSVVSSRLYADLFIDLLRGGGGGWADTRQGRAYSWRERDEPERWLVVSARVVDVIGLRTNQRRLGWSVANSDPAVSVATVRGSSGGSSGGRRHYGPTLITV